MVKSINSLWLIVLAAYLSFVMCCAIQSQVVIVSAAYLIFYVWELDEVIQLKHETEQMIQEVDEMLRVDYETRRKKRTTKDK